MESKNASAKSTWSIVLSILFLVWFVASIIGLIVTAKAQQMGWVAIVFGQYFVVFGFAGLISELKKGLRHPIIVVFPAVGLSVVTCGLLWQFGDETMQENVVAQIPNVIAGLFLLVGILLLLQVIFAKLEQKKCTYAVQGKCVEVKWHYSRSRNGRSTKTYCPVYEYCYNGQTYTGSQEIYTNLIHVSEGKYREIFINPDKPTVFYEKGVSRAFHTTAICIGIVFVIVSAIAIWAFNFQ